jgi:hypothetical protein
MLAVKATVTAEKAAERQKMTAKKGRRKDLLTAGKKALKEAEKDPKRPFPGLSRPQAADVKTEMRRNPNIRVEGLVSADFPLWEPPLPETPAERQAKVHRSKERCQEKLRAHINPAITVKHECGDEPSMVTGVPPPPQVSFSV